MLLSWKVEGSIYILHWKEAELNVSETDGRYNTFKTINWNLKLSSRRILHMQKLC